MHKLGYVVSVGLLASAFMLGGRASAQSGFGRKVLQRVPPRYPELARRMHIEGVVKLEVIVRPNGVVKSTKVLGGSPLLVQSAVDAVEKWKFEPSPVETTETAAFTFAGLN
jgi:TonB family protein